MNRLNKNRILWINRPEDATQGGCIDEIVLHEAEWVHIEQMSERSWWIGIDLSGGRYWAGNFTADSRGRMRFSEQENEGIEWDDDQEHQP